MRVITGVNCSYCERPLLSGWRRIYEAVPLEGETGVAYEAKCPHCKASTIIVVDEDNQDTAPHEPQK